MNKFLLTILLILAILSSSFHLVNSSLKVTEVETDWWNHNWSSRRKVEIVENSGFNLTNFPVEVTFQHSGNILPNGTDVRVIDDGIEIPSFVEETNSSHVKVIFETNLTASGTKYIHIYYNNLDATFPNYELVSLNVSEGNTGFAIIDDSVYIGWDYTSWGLSNNVELWNDFRIDFNGNNDLSDDNDLIRDYSSRQGGIGRHRKDTQAFGLGNYQTYVQTPILIDLRFENATLRVFKSQTWVETTQADFLWLFSTSFDYINFNLGVEENIVDESGWDIFYDSPIIPSWSALRDSSTGELLASSALNVGEDYNCWIAAKESSDYDRVVNYFGETAFFPVAPYDQPSGCKIFWFGDNSNNYTMIERRATILHNKPTVTVIPDLITVPTEFSTIQEAINSANNGDTIFVRSGTYQESVVVNKTISLIGEAQNSTIVRTEISVESYVFNITADKVLLANFTIENGYYGIYIASNNNSIKSNKIVQYTPHSIWEICYGIYFQNSNNNTITGNKILGVSYDGIRGLHSEGNNLHKNTIQNAGGFGMYLFNFDRGNINKNTVISSSLTLDDHCCNNTIIGNKLINGSLSLLAGYYNTLRNNTVLGVGDIGVGGYFLIHWINDVDASNTVRGKPLCYWINQHNKQVPSNVGSITIVNSTGIIVKDLDLTNIGVKFVFTTNSTIQNVIKNKGGISIHSSSIKVLDSYLNDSSYGVYVYYSNNTIIKNCTITDCNFGIMLMHSTNCGITENVFEGNGCAIGFQDSNSTIIYHNNFSNSTARHISINGAFLNNLWDNGCEGNYWSNYNGTDLDGNGIGDEYLPWEDVDNYPLMNPYWNPSDINYDLIVNIFDAVAACVAYTATPSDLHWNCHCDIAEPYGIINIFDIVLICSSYGEEYVP